MCNKAESFSICAHNNCKRHFVNLYYGRIPQALSWSARPKINLSRITHHWIQYFMEWEKIIIDLPFPFVFLVEPYVSNFCIEKITIYDVRLTYRSIVMSLFLNFWGRELTCLVIFFFQLMYFTYLLIGYHPQPSGFWNVKLALHQKNCGGCEEDSSKASHHLYTSDNGKLLERMASCNVDMFSVDWTVNIQATWKNNKPTICGLHNFLGELPKHERFWIVGRVSDSTSFEW